MILVIDNHDSFVYNLARLVRLAGGETEIVRNDACSLSQCLSLCPEAIILSPGPGRPEQAGFMMELIAALSHIPILGVCLGHQALAAHYGGTVTHAKRPLHGQAANLSHQGDGLFEGIASPMMVGRYHSLIATLPPSGPLQGIAYSEEGELMALAHTSLPHYGVQFHPESLLSKQGCDILKNFVEMVRRQKGSKP